VSRWGDHTGCQEGIGELEERVGTMIEALVERAAEEAQSVEGVGAFHSGAFCYRESWEATPRSRFLSIRLKRKLSTPNKTW
jgi:hypothetical protein